MVYPFIGKGVNWNNDTIKVALFPNTFVPNQAIQQFWSDVSASESAGTGYAGGGQTLTSKSDTYTMPYEPLSAANLQWTGVTLSQVRWAMIYKWTGVASTSQLIACIDIRINNSDIGVTSGTINLQWSASGIVRAIYS